MVLEKLVLMIIQDYHCTLERKCKMPILAMSPLYRLISKYRRIERQWQETCAYFLHDPSATMDLLHGWQPVQDDGFERTFRDIRFCRQSDATVRQISEAGEGCGSSPVQECITIE
jgi:hypothetical protein